MIDWPRVLFAPMDKFVSADEDYYLRHSQDNITLRTKYLLFSAQLVKPDFGAILSVRELLLV